MENIIINLLNLIIATIIEIFIVGACFDVNNNEDIGTTLKRIITGEK